MIKENYAITYVVIRPCVRASTADGVSGETTAN